MKLCVNDVTNCKNFVILFGAKETIFEYKNILINKLLK